MQAWTMTHASYAPQATHHTWQFHSSHPLWPFSIANKIDLVSRSNLSAEINNSQHNLLFSSCGSRVKIFLIYLWVNLSSFHISIYCVTFVQILRSFLPFKQAVRWGQHDFCSLLSVKFAKTIFMQNYVGPIYLHIRKPIVCKIPPLSLLNNTKYSLDSRNISLIAAFLKKKFVTNNGWNVVNSKCTS